MNSEIECPICEKNFSTTQIEQHVDKCLFLCSQVSQPRKKARNSSQTNNEKSPSINSYSQATQLKSDNFDNILDFKHGNQKVVDNQKQAGTSNSNSKQSQNNASQFCSNVVASNNTSNTLYNLDNFSFSTPLAQLMKPKELSDFIGQSHVFGQESILRSLVSGGDVPSLILWGPPGCGKTSFANVIQELCKKNPNNLRYTTLNAAESGIKDVQNVVKTAKNQKSFGKETILFMDEIHRFNKRQQDAFLGPVEKGDIILIGATTENPSFCVNNALLSRCRVITFDKLSSNSLLSIINNALEKFNVDIVKENVESKSKYCIEKDAVVWLADVSDGDARIALMNLQLVLQQYKNKLGIITLDSLKEEIKNSHLLYDRKGEEHYNQISALHKCIRSSDENAALYWLTRMIIAGEDPLYIARRMVRAASEDIGNKDPTALQLAVSTMQGCQLLGYPDCDVLLSQCCIYLARAPKSREADSALAKAKMIIKNLRGPQPTVPLHLRNAPTKLTRELGYGKSKGNSSNMPNGLEDTDFF